MIIILKKNALEEAMQKAGIENKLALAEKMDLSVQRTRVILCQKKVTLATGIKLADAIGCDIWDIAERDIDNTEVKAKPEVIASLMPKKGFSSQKDLAKAIGMSEATVSRVFRGYKVTEGLLVKIAKALNCDLADIVEVIV